jgi:hypothetical protein
MAALKELKLRFAIRLQTIDDQHPLIKRITPPMIIRGKGAGNRQRPKTKIQRLSTLLPKVPRPKLRAPHFTNSYRVNPIYGIDKKTALDEFKRYWASLPLEDVTIFLDRLE